MTTTAIHNNKTSRVGIFMPCYNLGEYIEQAINSLKKQTFQDFTVIIADDCSPDKKTIEKLESLTLPDNFSIFFESKNLGMNAITNKYAKRIKSEYLLILSGDDTLKEDYLEKTVQFLDRNIETAAVTSWLQYFGESDGVREYDPKKTDLKSMLLENNFCGSALIRKSVWDAVGGYGEGEYFRRHQDYDLWLSALEQGYRLGVIEEPLFNYRILKSSLSHDLDAEWEKNWLQHLINKHKDSYQTHFPEILSEYYRQTILTNQAWQTLHDGHEWLDQEYKSTVERLQITDSELQDVRRERDDLQVKVDKLRKYSLYPLLSRIKRMFAG